MALIQVISFTVQVQLVCLTYMAYSQQEAQQYESQGSVPDRQVCLEDRKKTKCQIALSAWSTGSKGGT